jgi:hypothetical protein
MTTKPQPDTSKDWWKEFVKIRAKHRGEEFGDLGAAVEELDFIQQEIDRAVKEERERIVRSVKLEVLGEVTSLGYALRWKDYEIKRLNNGLNDILDKIEKGEGV